MWKNLRCNPSIPNVKCTRIHVHNEISIFPANIHHVICKLDTFHYVRDSVFYFMSALSPRACRHGCVDTRMHTIMSLQCMWSTCLSRYRSRYVSVLRIVLSYNVYIYCNSNQPILELTQEWFRELSFSRLECGVHRRFIFTPCVTAWDILLPLASTPDRRDLQCLNRKDTGNVHGVNELAHVSKWRTNH